MMDDEQGMDDERSVASTYENRMQPRGRKERAVVEQECLQGGGNPMREAKPTRLSINIARDTVEALQEIASDKHITITESVRRLVGYGVIVYRAYRDGHEILLRRDGKLEKIIPVD